MSAMSRDRIEFDLNLYPSKNDSGWKERRWSSSGAKYVDYDDMVERTLGINADDVDAIRRGLRGTVSVRVKARPSQFARFLVLRNVLGYANSFKDLNAEIVAQEPVPEKVETWRNPNRVDADYLQQVGQG